MASSKSNSSADEERKAAYHQVTKKFQQCSITVPQNLNRSSSNAGVGVGVGEKEF